MAPTSFADLASLLSISPEAKQAIAGSDPYLGLKQAPDLVSQVLLKSSTDTNIPLKDKIIAGLLTGVASGGLGALSEDYQGRAQKAYGDVLASDILGKPVERPSVLYPSIFNQAGQQADIFRNNKALLERDIELEKATKLEDALRGRGIVVGQDGLLQQIESLDPTAQTVRQREALLPILEQEQALRGKLNPRGTKVNVDTGLGVQQSKEWAGDLSLADRATNLSSRLEELKPSYASLSGAKLFSALDKDGLASEIQDTADSVLRNRSGAAAPVAEKKELQKIIAGDFSAGYSRISFLLKKFADRTKQSVIKETEVADALKAGGTQGLRDLIGREGTTNTSNLQDLSGYTQEQIAYMKSKGML